MFGVTWYLLGQNAWIYSYIGYVSFRPISKPFELWKPSRYFIKVSSGVRIWLEINRICPCKVLFELDCRLAGLFRQVSVCPREGQTLIVTSGVEVALHPLRSSVLFNVVGCFTCERKDGRSLNDVSSASSTSPELLLSELVFHLIFYMIASGWGALGNLRKYTVVDGIVEHTD